MAEAKKQMSVFVTGGAEDVGLAAVRALLKRGHKVIASACTSDGALALRLAGALPVYPDLGRASEVLKLAANGRGKTRSSTRFPNSAAACRIRARPTPRVRDQLVRFTEAVAEAAAQHGVQRIVSLSFGYLYEGGHGAAVKKAPTTSHDSAYLRRCWRRRPRSKTAA